MKVLIRILSLIVLFNFFSCKKSTIEFDMNLRNKIYFAYCNDTNNVLDSLSYNNKKFKTVTIKESLFKFGLMETPEITKYLEYNNSGKIIKDKIFKNKIIYNRKEYFYDSLKNLIKIVRFGYRNDLDTSRIINLLYNFNNQLIEIDKVVIPEKKILNIDKNDIDLFDWTNTVYTTDELPEIYPKTTYKYEKNNIKEIIKWNSYGKILDKKIFNYDSLGNIIEALFYEKNKEENFTYKESDLPPTRTTPTIDLATSRLYRKISFKKYEIEDSYFNKIDSFNYKLGFKYNDKFNLISENKYDCKGNLIYEILYKYGNNNNLIEKSNYIENKLKQKFIYIYNSSSKVVEENIFVDNSETPDTTRKNLILENGLIGENIILDKNKNQISKTTYKYDNTGNVIEITNYDNTNEPIKITLYEYQYYL